LRSIVVRLLYAFIAALCSQCIFGGEIIPPAPDRHFKDYAGVVSPTVASSLDKTLEDFERETSNQILVTIFQKMQSDSSIEDYTVRIAQSWKVGKQGRDNGAVLFVFIQDRKMFLQVGYGLEGALPDALAKQIIETELKPRFRTGDYEGGLTAGINAILAATRGEYRGSGQTVPQQHQRARNFMPILFFVGFACLILLAKRNQRRTFRRRGWLGSPGGWVLGSGGYSSGGGWTSRGGGFSSGGFSGGGGRFGGGGAGGSW
jgi:uncharacterized protein